MDTEKEKALFLKSLGRHTKQVNKAIEGQRAALGLARNAGASLRELAEQMGISHTHVKRILADMGEADPS